MHRYPRGIVVQQADLADVAVNDGRSYVVTDDGELVLSTRDKEVARFMAGSWIAVRRAGVALRDVWPPEDFDYLMADLGERLVVLTASTSDTRWSPSSTRSTTTSTRSWIPSSSVRATSLERTRNTGA